MDKNPTLLNIDLRYFSDCENSEHWQWMLLDFFVQARHDFIIVYGTRATAIIGNTNIGKRALFSFEAAITTFWIQWIL